MKTRDELESELQAAQHQLRELKQAHNVFLHKISHDLKTPSNEIIGSLSQLNQETQSPMTIDYVQTALRACMRLDHLLDQLLTLDELANQKVKINRTEFDLHIMLNNQLQLTQEYLAELEKAKSVDIKIQWVYPFEKLSCVVGDKEKLSKIINEILRNAAHHTEKGTITVKIDCIEEASTHVALEISVTDTGSGIPQDQLDTIFRPFSHYADFFTHNSDKVPLSLVLCQKLVHLMFGALTIESTPGQGTCVKIRLGFPLAKSSTHLRSQPQSKLTFNGTYIENTDKPILIVDDNPVNRNVLTAIIRRLGFETKQAANGKEALAIFKSHSFALVFMDCQMPILNGFEATQAIRKLHSPVPIIAVTANTTDEDIQRCFASGMDDFLAKPITPTKIGQTLSRWLTNTERQQSKL